MVCADTFRAGAFDQLKQNATKLRVRERDWLKFRGEQHLEDLVLKPAYYPLHFDFFCLFCPDGGGNSALSTAAIPRRILCVSPMRAWSNSEATSTRYEWVSGVRIP